MKSAQKSIRVSRIAPRSGPGTGPQLKFNYSAKSHKGFEQLIPTVIRGGRAVPFTDWSIVISK
jgi:hypothetical protein